MLFHFPTLMGCAGLAVTGYVGAAVTPYSVTEPTFPFTGGAVRVCCPSLLLLLFLFVEQNSLSAPCFAFRLRHLLSP